MWIAEKIDWDPDNPDHWRIFDTSDSSMEATICEFWSGENDNAELAQKICELHNTNRIEVESVKIPTSAKQAQLMVLLGIKYLSDNYPEMLKSYIPE